MQAINMTYSEIVFLALDIKHAVRMRHIVVCGLSGAALFFTIISKQSNFPKTVMEHKMCVLINCTTLSQTFLILRRTGRDVMKNVCWFSCAMQVVVVVVSGSNET